MARNYNFPRIRYDGDYRRIAFSYQ
jgi:hypothetical protein